MNYKRWQIGKKKRQEFLNNSAFVLLMLQKLGKEYLSLYSEEKGDSSGRNLQQDGDECHGFAGGASGAIRAETLIRRASLARASQGTLRRGFSEHCSPIFTFTFLPSVTAFIQSEKKRY